MRLKHLLIGGLLPCTVMLCGTLTTARADCVQDNNCPPCAQDDLTLLLPDLVTLPPSHVRVVRHLGHRVILFSTEIGNVGDGPMVLKGHTIRTSSGQTTQASQAIQRTDGTTCTRVAGDFVFHPTHRHFHFEDFSNYLLRKDDPLTGPVVASSTKVSFCLLDIKPLPGFNLFPQIVPNCLSAEGTEGISVGWADEYDFFLPDQDIDLDTDPANPVPEGDYFLVNTVNPQGRLWESNPDMTNNTGFISVRVPAAAGAHPNPAGHFSGGGHLPHQPHAPRPPRPPNPHMLINGSGPHAPAMPHRPFQQDLTGSTQSPHLPHLPAQPHVPNGQ